MEAGTVTPTSQAAPPPRLREKYEQEVLPALTKKFGLHDPDGRAAPDQDHLEHGPRQGETGQPLLRTRRTNSWRSIAGQHPNVRRARKSIASFKVREGMPVGVSVTLRRARMWEFLDRLTSIAVPRIRDFRGLNPRSFDGRGNYSMGVKEQLIFPEIDYDSVDIVRGLDITMTTSAKTDLEAFELLLGAGHAVRAGGPSRPGRARSRGKSGRGRAAQKRRPASRPRPSRPPSKQLKEENPEAYAKPETEEGEGAEGAEGGNDEAARARPTEESSESMAKTSQKVRQGRKAKFRAAELQPLPPLRSPARLLPQVRPLPDLPARGRPRGVRPRHDQVELVGRTMQTDPIADYLTRIRNAIRAGHDEVEIPASGLKMELSRILKEQGYITDFHKKPATRRRGDRGQPEVHRGPQACHPRDRTGLPPRPPPLRRSQKRAAGAGRHRDRDRQHLGTA